jgi:superkiller protein 3
MRLSFFPPPIRFLATFVALAAFCPAQTNLERGIQLLTRERYESAIEELRIAEKAQPRSAAIHNLVGIALTKMGRFADANAEYKQAIELAPHSPDPYKNLGFNYWNEKQDKQAEELFLQALRIDPDDGFANYYLGMLYLTDGRDREAVQRLEKAPTLIETDVPALLQLAEAYFRLKRPQLGLETVSRIERRPPASTQEEYRLAVLLTTYGFAARAVPHFRNLQKNDPVSFANNFNLAIALAESKQYHEAIQLLETLAASHPQNGDLLGALGAAYEASGNQAGALESYAKAVKADPANQDYYLEYTRLLMSLDRINESLAVLQQGLRNVPDAYALSLRLGAAQFMAGNYQLAERIFREAITSHPEVPVGYVALSKSLMKEGRASEAVDVLKTAAGQMPSDFFLQYFYGLALEHVGRTKAAVEVFLRAMSLNPQVPEGHYELGKLLLKTGQASKAVEELRRAVQIAPQCAEVYWQLSRAYLALGNREKSEELAGRAKQLRAAQTEMEETKARERDRLRLKPQS